MKARDNILPKLMSAGQCTALSPVSAVVGPTLVC
jgi:hypothetical protein